MATPANSLARCQQNHGFLDLEDVLSVPGKEHGMWPLIEGIRQ
jgi:hypothetical protein